MKIASILSLVGGSLILFSSVSCTTTSQTSASSLASNTGSGSASIQVNKPGDSEMTCSDIQAEIAEMNKILGIAEGEMRNATALGLTQDALIHGALYSGALGSAGSAVPYLGAAMNVAGGLSQKKKQEAEALKTAAFNRRSVLTGMYAAKGCGS